MAENERVVGEVLVLRGKEGEEIPREARRRSGAADGASRAKKSEDGMAAIEDAGKGTE